MSNLRHNYGIKPTEWDKLIGEVIKQGDYLVTQRKFNLDGIARKSKDDGSPQTSCDTDVECELKKVLHSFGNSYAIISEEAPMQDNLLAMESDDYIWVMDPIDGTKTYMDGYDEYTINVALLSPPSKEEPHNRTPVMGIVYAPAKQEIFFTKHDGKSYYTQTNPGFYDDKMPPFAGKPIEMHAPERTYPGYPARIAVGHDEGKEQANFFSGHHNPVAVNYTGAYRTAQVANAAADAALFSYSSAIWDIAAADAVLRGAGGRAFSANTDSKTITGDSLYYGTLAKNYHKGNPLETGPYVTASPMMLADLKVATETGILISQGRRY